MVLKSPPPQGMLGLQLQIGLSFKLVLLYPEKLDADLSTEAMSGASA